MTESLIPKSEFLGLQDCVHLAAGGETPMLKSHRQAVDQFMNDKSRGEFARDLEANMVEQARTKCAALFSVTPAEITFLSSASEGINNLAYGLNWQAGDNVIIVDVEFPSVILPWTRFERLGVEVRVVKHKNWLIDLEDIAARIDARTRVVAISHVSMFTGQRIDLNALSKLVRSSNALLLLEARQILIWGAYAGFGRLRISTHLYNNSEDVERCISALQSVG